MLPYLYVIYIAKVITQEASGWTGAGIGAAIGGFIGGIIGGIGGYWGGYTVSGEVYDSVNK